MDEEQKPVECEPCEDHFTEVLESYKLHTDRMRVLLHMWVEAMQRVADPDDEKVMDALRHRLKITLDDTTHEKMLRAVSVSVAAQFMENENEAPQA